MGKKAADWFKDGLDAVALSATADTQRELREDRETALNAFEQALALDPRFPDAQRYRGMMLAALGRDEEAVDAFVSASALAPDDLELRLSTGVALARLGLAEGALAAFDGVLGQDPDQPDALHGRAKALTELKRDEEALDAWQRVLAIDDSRVMRLDDGRRVRLLGGDFRRGQARATVAQLSCRLGRPDAKQAWRELLEADVDALVGFSLSPVFLESMRRDPPCRAAFEDYVAAHASDARTWSRASSVWAQLGDRPAALEAMQQAVALAPENGQLWFSLGECFSTVERFGEATQAYQRSLEAPNGPHLAAEQRLEMIRTHGVAWKTE